MDCVATYIILTAAVIAFIIYILVKRVNLRPYEKTINCKVSGFYSVNW